MARGSWIVLAGLLAMGCGAPIARLLPENAVAGSSIETAIQVAHARGYQIALSQPNRGRIGLIALYEDEASLEHGTYRIAITCNPGVCQIRPIGPRVEFYEGRYFLPEPFLEEVYALRRHLIEANANR